ncbi:thioredoxin domain-containing protein [Chitinibacter fontanus]|uniref:Thioredoxin domain-containing protein n=1 Tax=Chitinibacter fontanus TaxID=1737446 RepID=A0A7D5Z3N7_9NEIS|nr:thioredoxin domain-containing protein [Chitinibacter fontanus]QLI81681.1 thioredoxin domain-containing protein [Chitinibacter fontanus]
MQRRAFLSCLAALPLWARADDLAQLQQEAERRKQLYLAQLQDLAQAQPSAIFHQPLDIVLGPALAHRTVLVFSDFNCPYCRQLDPLLQQLAGDDVRFVMKWQTLMAETSGYAAHYALQVWRHRRSVYPDVHQQLMQAPLPLELQHIDAIARRTNTYHLLPKTAPLPSILQASVQLGQQLRIFATPTMLVGARMMGGMVDIETLQAAIGEWSLTP